jgi:DNA anti-recombination protein RmuC
MRWLVTIVVIAIVAFLGYRYYYTDSGQEMAELVEDAAGQAAQKVEEATEVATEEVEQATDETADTAEQATDQAADTAEQAADSAEQTADEAADGAQETAEQATEATEQAADEATDTAEQAADEAGQATAALTEGGIDLGQEVGTAVSDAKSALEGITDKASAEAALPSLEGVKTKLDELGATVGKLPDAGKEALASLLDDSLPELQALVTKVEGIEGVGEVVKPTLDSIVATLEDWAKQPA